MEVTNPKLDTPTTRATDYAPEPRRTGDLLVSLVALPPDALEETVQHLRAALPNQAVMVAVPYASSEITVAPSPGDSLKMLSYTPSAPLNSSLFLSPSDFVSTFKLAEEQGAAGCLMLGAECHTLQPEAIRALAAAVLHSAADLAVPRYHLGAQEGLVNSAILYPVTGALYGARPRFPLAIDLGLSIRMAERLAMCAQKYTAAGQNEAIVWPVPEAAAANFAIAEIDAGPRSLPHSDATDLNALLAQIAGSLFADVDAKAAIWQRVRSSAGQRPLTESAPVAATDVAPMVDAFRLAYSHLTEIWSLVLPPNSLLGLKRLAQMPAAEFRMGDQLWARIVYDFILAYRMRTINRGHLLGALTPLYLAWVASHIILTNAGTPAEQHIEALATVFETDKPYLVSRWRWPDRFNP